MIGIDRKIKVNNINNIIIKDNNIKIIDDDFIFIFKKKK